MAMYQNPKRISGQVYIIIIVAIGIVLYLMNYNRLNHIVKIAMALTYLMIFSSIINFDKSVNFYVMICYIIMWSLAMNITHAYNYQVDNKRYFVKVSIIYCLVSIYLYTLYLYSDYSNIYKSYTITSVYYLVTCLPIVLCIESKLLKSTLVSLIVIGVIISFKRSALVTLCVVVIAFLLKKKDLKKWFKYVMIVLLVVISVLLFIKQDLEFLYNIRDIWHYRFFYNSNMITDVRQDVYLEVLKLQMNSTFLEWIVGHGYNAVQKVTSTGYSAHNDYLEILYNYGLFAFILYVVLIIELIKLYRKKAKDPDYPSFSLLVSICVLCVPSFFSHLLTYPTYFLILSMYWGWVIPKKAA